MDLAQSMYLTVSCENGLYEQMVQAYHSELTSLSKEIAAEYSYDQCWADFRMAVLLYYGACNVYGIDIFAQADVDIAETGKSDLVNAFVMGNVFLRAAKNCQHLDLLGLFGEILEKISKGG